MDLSSCFRPTNDIDTLQLLNVGYILEIRPMYPLFMLGVID